MRGELLLLSTRSTMDYAADVAYHLETFPEMSADYRLRDMVSRLRPVRFADGEMEVEVNTTLRGKDVFVFANAGRNDLGLSVEENKLELYHAVDALQRSQAGRITLFEPYCSSSRSDRTTRRNSVGFWVHYKTLMALGVNHIITYQLHSEKSRTVVDPTLCAIDDVPANALLAEYLCDTYVKTRDRLDEHVRENWVFCSVDAGGEGLAKKFANAFGTDLVIAHKHRDYTKTNTVESINILSDAPIEDKEVFIVDDMIDTAGSVDALVRELNTRDVAGVHILAIHPVLSDPATARLRALYDEGLLQNLVVADTLKCGTKLREALPFVHLVPSTRLSAEIVLRMHREESLSPFFEDFDPRAYMSRLKLST